jgi:hypothetical protein
LTAQKNETGNAGYLVYSSDQPDLIDFSEWLAAFISTQHFIDQSNKYSDIYKRLKTEQDSEKRHYLGELADGLE